MRRNISANIVSIGSMRIAEVRVEVAMAAAAAAEVEEGTSRRVGPFHLSVEDSRPGRVVSFCDSS